MSIGGGVPPQATDVAQGAGDNAAPDLAKPIPAIKANLFSINLGKSTGFPEQNGRTLAQDNGYIDGLSTRQRGVRPANYVLIGRDEYCLGFRAGYFAGDRALLCDAGDVAGKQRRV